MNEAERSTDGEELLMVNQRLLDAIADGDWDVYSQLCDAGITAFEPEACGHLVEGLDFHKFYFDLGGASGPSNTTMSSPNVWMLGPDAGLVTYVRLVQKLDAAGNPVTRHSEETRVWLRRDGKWKHVHFHRSTFQ
jgi:calcium/calmodulin-dependent protein kinase (CaM kinase) II